MRHVVFRLGVERYALPLAAVREVVNPASMSRVPRSPPAVLGIMNLRGRVVTVVDLRALLGVGPPPDRAVAPPPGKVILLDRGRRDLGLLATDVDGIHDLQDFSPAPGESSPSVRGLAEGPDSAITVLDGDGIDRQVAALFRTRPRAA